MGLFHPNDVLEESWLLFSITGLLGLRLVGRRDLRRFSYLWAIFLAVLHSALSWVIRDSILPHYESLQDVIYYFQNHKLQGHLSLVVVPAVIFSSIFKSCDELTAYKKLVEIDRVLLYLNVPIDHDIQMRKEVVRLLGYVLTTAMTNLVTYFSIVTVDSGFIFDVSCLLNFTPVFLEAITLCAFDIFVRKISSRFERINYAIRELLGPRKISVILVQSSGMNQASKLRLARRVHLQLHDAASAINTAYGLRLFTVFLATLISVVNCFSNARNLVENELQTLDLSLYVIWAFFHVGKYIFIVNSCRAATAEAKLAGEFFIEGSLARGADGLSYEAEALSRQLINTRLDFNISSVFSINFSRGLMIFTAALTYFLLLA